MDFEEYHLHVETALDPLDRLEEEKLLKRCGRADWALKLRAMLLGHWRAHLFPLTPIAPCYLLCKLNQAHDGSLQLDEFCQAEYDRIKQNFDAAKHLCVEDCT